MNRREHPVDTIWRLAPRAAGMLAVVAGLLALLGWLLGILPIQHLSPDGLGIRPNTALCFMLAGATLWLQAGDATRQDHFWRIAARVCIAVLLLIVAVTLYEHLADADLGIDYWPPGKDAGASGAPAPNRMTLLATIGFLLLGSALIFNDSAIASDVWCRILASLAAAPAVISLLSVLYGLPSHYNDHAVRMAVHTSLVFGALAIGILASHPRFPLPSLLKARGIGRIFAQRLMPAALLLPPLFAWMAFIAARFGNLAMEYTLMLTTSIQMFAFSVLVLYAGDSLQRLDARRKRSEKALIKSSERFFNAFNASGFPAMILAEDGAVLALNEAWTEATGYTREDIRTLDDWTQRANTEKSAGMNALIMASFNRGAVTEAGELRVAIKSGNLRTWEFGTAPIGQDTDGRRLLMLTARDVTERRRTEESLRIMSLAIKQSPVAVIISDANARIQYVNPKFTELTGYFPAEVIGRNGGILKSPAHTESFYLGMLRTVESGKIWQGEIHSCRKNGEMYWEQVSVAPILDSNGMVRNFITIKESISERKRTEEALVMRKDQLKGLYAALHTIREEERRRFSRELHDELGQMLTALRIDLNWLEGNLPAATVAPSVFSRMGAINVLLEQTVDAVRRISEDLRPGMLDSLGLAPAIESYVDKFSLRTGVKCRLDISGAEDLVDDKVSIVVFRIVQEALNNTTKYAHAENVSIRLDQRMHEIALAIQDDGVGFSRSPDGRKGGYGILGMRERVAMLNGQFSIISAPGAGVRIEATIPLWTR